MTRVEPIYTSWSTAIKHSMGGLNTYQYLTLVQNIQRVVVNHARCFRYFLLLCLAILFLTISLSFISTDKEAQHIPDRPFQHVFSKTSALVQEDESPLIKEDQVQRNRQTRVDNVCKWVQKKDESSKIPPLAEMQSQVTNHIYVDDKYKFIYCEVPKVACTNFKAIMELLTEKVNATGPEKLQPHLVHGEYQKKYLRKLSNYTPSEISHRINNYYKFMFVREPLERILSAYRNKFTVSYSDYFKVRFGRYIVKNYRKNPSQVALAKGHDVTFGEFVQYLTDPVTSRKLEFNPHWQHYYKLCLPCQIKYDFIGKYENLKEDVDSVLQHIGIGDVVKFPKTKSKTRTTVGVVKSFFKNITSQDVHRLWQLYSVDYSMFGYHYPNVH